MKYFDWSATKNEQLKEERGISFEEVLIALDEGKLLDVVAHPNEKQYPHQKIFIIDVNEYAYLVPYTEDDEKVFLKTIIPSRMDHTTLNHEEKKLLQDFEAGKLQSVPDVQKEKKRFQAYAKHTFKKSKNINIRLPERDLQHLKAIAAEKGLPYQTLISSLLHQYSTSQRKT